MQQSDETTGASAEITAGITFQRILVIIPTYNEKENLARVVREVLAQDQRIDILVVDDDSPDGTGQLAQDLMATESRLNLLARAGKEGLGRAYIAGFQWGLARDYDLFFEMDADLSHPPDHLPRIIAAASHHDLVIGSRYVGGRVTVINWPISRLLLSYFGCFYARTITGLPVSDATAGFNCFRRSTLEAIALDRIRSNGYSFQIELKFRAWKNGARIGEIPIVFTERDTGESKMSKKIVREAVWKVWWIRILYIFGRL